MLYVIEPGAPTLFYASVSQSYPEAADFTPGFTCDRPVCAKSLGCALAARFKGPLITAYHTPDEVTGNIPLAIMLQLREIAPLSCGGDV
jgi:hypothetical protein